MRFASSFYGALALAVFCSLAAPAHAGQLFPPSNLVDPAQNCPSGEVLVWDGAKGTVDCADPSPGVNVTACPAGQVLSGITNGVATCVQSASIGLPTQLGPDTNYTAASDGFVFVSISADPSHRAAIVYLIVDGNVMATVMAQDSTVTGVPSNSWGNATYPVRKGQSVQVAIADQPNTVFIQFIPLQSGTAVPSN